MHNFAVTLDGYATGRHQSTTAPFGEATPEFLAWFERLRIWRDSPADDLHPDELIARAWNQGVGAEIMGRNKFRPTRGPWPDDGWRGWWGDEPSFHTPCFVLTHYPRDPIVAGDTTFHFVNAEPSEVLAQARVAARELDVRLGGGPSTVNQFLAADLIDHLHVIVLPIVIGGGEPLWTDLAGLQRRFDVQTVASPTGATHLFFTRHTPGYDLPAGHLTAAPVIRPG